MKIGFTVVAILATSFALDSVFAFQIGKSSLPPRAALLPRKHLSTGQTPDEASLTSSLKRTALQANKDDLITSSNEGWFDDIAVNPIYLIPYVSFLAFGVYATTSETPGASQAILDQFLSDPLHPVVNELFATVFNLIGLVGIPLACILMPTAKFQKWPATPFLLASAAAGYGAIGPYVMTRRPLLDNQQITQNDLGWFTANVLENKVFNWFMVAVAFSSLFTTGVLDALSTDFTGTVQGYIDLFTNTAICSASSVDFTILCCTMASLIPQDLQQRGVTNRTTATAIAVATLLLPMMGATLYCALRPPLPKE